MGIVKRDEIRGYQFEQKVVCLKCATEDGLKDLKEDEILTNDDIDRSDDIYFCDECKEEL